MRHQYSPPATAQNLNVTLGGMGWELFTFFSSLATEIWLNTDKDIMQHIY